jgi:hypothetical protein
MDEKFYNLTPEEQRAIVHRIINEPGSTEGSSESVASILYRLDELKSVFDRLPITTHAHRTSDKDPLNPYIPLAHR